MECQLCTRAHVYEQRAVILNAQLQRRALVRNREKHFRFGECATLTAFALLRLDVNRMNHEQSNICEPRRVAVEVERFEIHGSTVGQISV